jgi:hypothetical protein
MVHLPEGTLSGSALGSYAAVVAVDSLQRAPVRHCAERQVLKSGYDEGYFRQAETEATARLQQLLYSQINNNTGHRKRNEPRSEKSEPGFFIGLNYFSFHPERQSCAS